MSRLNAFLFNPALLVPYLVQALQFLDHSPQQPPGHRLVLVICIEHLIIAESGWLLRNEYLLLRIRHSSPAPQSFQTNNLPMVGQHHPGQVQEGQGVLQPEGCQAWSCSPSAQLLHQVAVVVFNLQVRSHSPRFILTSCSSWSSTSGNGQAQRA